MEYPCMETTDKEGLIRCKLNKFGGFPDINVCLKACKGDAEKYLASIYKPSYIPNCQYLGEDGKSCSDNTVITEVCPKISGGSCRHYLPGKLPDCGCNNGTNQTSS